MHELTKTNMQFDEMGISGDAKSFGSIGHYCLWKGHLVFITADHVIGDAKTVCKSPHQPHKEIGKPVCRSRIHDFCIVKLNNPHPRISLAEASSYDGIRIGLAVYKIGASTGLTKGYINFTDGPAHYMVRPERGCFARPGDSGAAVSAVEDGRPVGILVGQLGLHWVVLSIQFIIDTMGTNFYLLAPSNPQSQL